MRRILPIACVAFAFTVGLSAQTTGTGTSPQESKTHRSMSAKPSGKTVTLTGCLREGDMPGSYQLTNVDMSSMGAKSGKGTRAHGSTATSGGSASGTEGASGQAGMGNMGSMGTINLIAGGSVDLKEHVGHRVQVTGNWAGDKPTSGTTGSVGEEQPPQAGATPPAAPEPGSQMGSKDTSGHQLTVKTLKHISDTCQ